MSVIVQCDCGKKYKVGNDKAGKRIRCKACSGVVDIPMPKADPVVDEWDDDGGDEFNYEPLRPQTRKPTRAPVEKQSSANKVAIIAAAVGGGTLLLAGAIVFIVKAATTDDDGSSGGTGGTSMASSSGSGGTNIAPQPAANNLLPDASPTVRKSQPKPRTITSSRTTSPSVGKSQPKPRTITSSRTTSPPVAKSQPKPRTITSSRTTSPPVAKSQPKPRTITSSRTTSPPVGNSQPKPRTITNSRATSRPVNNSRPTKQRAWKMAKQELEKLAEARKRQGDLQGYLKYQGAAGACAAIETGDSRLLRSFGSDAIGIARQYIQRYENQGYPGNTSRTTSRTTSRPVNNSRPTKQRAWKMAKQELEKLAEARKRQGDLQGYLKYQGAAGACAAIETGDSRLLRSFGSDATGIAQQYIQRYKNRGYR